MKANPSLILSSLKVIIFGYLNFVPNKGLKWRNTHCPKNCFCFNISSSNNLLDPNDNFYMEMKLNTMYVWRGYEKMVVKLFNISRNSLIFLIRTK